MNCGGGVWVCVVPIVLDKWLPQIASKPRAVATARCSAACCRVSARGSLQVGSLTSARICLTMIVCCCILCLFVVGLIMLLFISLISCICLLIICCSPSPRRG